MAPPTNNDEASSTGPWSRLHHPNAAALQAALGIQNPHFASRIFAALEDLATALNRPKSDLRASAEWLASAPLDAKLNFFFRLHDANGDGRIDRRELEWMIHVALGESGLFLPPGKAEELVATMLSQADLNRDQTLSFEEFQRVVAQRPQLSARLAERGVAMLQIGRQRALSRGSRSKGEDGWGAWIRQNSVLAGWMGVFVAVNLVLFVHAFVVYGDRGANIWIQIARGCGACLNLCGPWLLIPMLRHLWTAIRKTSLAPMFPLDDNIDIHRAVGEGVFFLSVVHSLAHIGNLLSQVSSKLWTSPAVLTGFALLGILVAMWLCARPRVRQSGRFELFHRVHLAYWLWFALALVHGPVFWIWFLVPGTAFVVEQIFRRRSRSRPAALVDARIE